MFYGAKHSFLSAEIFIHLVANWQLEPHVLEHLAVFSMTVKLLECTYELFIGVVLVVDVSIRGDDIGLNSYMILFLILFYVL